MLVLVPQKYHKAASFRIPVTPLFMNDLPFIRTTYAVCRNKEGTHFRYAQCISKVRVIGYTDIMWLVIQTIEYFAYYRIPPQSNSIYWLGRITALRRRCS